jgi:hypothetical protein
MRARTAAAFLLSTFLAAAAYSPSPAGQGKDPPKDKEPTKEPTKLPEIKWPTNIGGKGVKEWLKDATENPDPAVREFSLKMLPNFGPDARKECSKKLVARMTAEKDPGVRITVFNTAATLGLEESEVKEAVRILGLTVDNQGGLARLHAVQTLALIGPKAEGAVYMVAGRALEDPAYETRRSIANTLGRIGFDEVTGPNHKALMALAGILARDISAAVRMESLQSIVILGPPWEKPKGKGAPPGPPPIDWTSPTTVAVADAMRVRIGAVKGKGAVETDKQIEIWCRVVLMRFDQKEAANDAHLQAIAKNIEDPEAGPQIQALQALALFGERAAVVISDVVKAIRVDDPAVKTIADIDPTVFSTALAALASMGEKAKGVVSHLQKAEQKLEKMREERKKDPELQKLVANLKPDELKLVYASLQEEQLRMAVAETIKFINASKPGRPGPDPPAAPAPAEKKP